eukprot:COSAG05_NODE_629_length_8215_cov_26.328241_6_plen_337_part_00
MPLPQYHATVTMHAVYRVAEGGATAPDFLAEHNSGDAAGDVAFLSTCGGDGCGFYNFTASPRVRYCVELLGTGGSGGNSSDGSQTWFPYPTTTNSSHVYADYLSCPGAQLNRYAGDCNCAVWSDRIIAHESLAELDTYCQLVNGSDGDSGSSWRQCGCANASSGRPIRWPADGFPNISVGQQNPSKWVTGMMPVPLPCTAMLAFLPPGHSGDNGSHNGTGPNGWAPGLYKETVPWGHWYSHPSHSQCGSMPDDSQDKHAQQSPEMACTWRLDTRATMVYGATLVKHGWNTTDEQLLPHVIDGRGHVWQWVSMTRTRANTAAFMRAFAAFNPRCCGC